LRRSSTVGTHPSRSSRGQCVRAESVGFGHPLACGGRRLLGHRGPDIEATRPEGPRLLFGIVGGRRDLGWGR